MDNQSGELGGLIWLIMDVGMVAALAVVIVFAILQWRKHRRAEPPLDLAAEERKARRLVGRE